MNLIQHDKLQRELALDASRSFIVQAPAGSGKTELLIQRFLTLLTHVKTPEEILAITFTKKAANEMRARVIKALKHAETHPEPESDHAKKTWRIAKEVLQRDAHFNWHLIANPNQLRIQTIDSLCAYLTKQLPLLSHFGSQPSISDYPALLYREAVQEVLAHVEENYEWSQSLSKLLLHLDNDLNKLHDLLITLLAKRDQWLPYIRLDTNDAEIKKLLESHLASVIAETLTAAHDLFPKPLASELIAIARFAADNLAISQKDSEILSCRNLNDLPKPIALEKKAWLGIAQLLLTKSHSWRKRVDAEIGFPALTTLKNPQEKNLHAEFRQRLIQLISRLSEQEDLRLALAEIFFLPNSNYDQDQWEILQSLLRVLKIVAAQLRVTFQQHGQIDFIENAQAAFAALGSDDHPTDLALALDYQIRHILVDEFQDTSLTQYQLLEKLTTGWEANDGRTLFVVGDPMQSIYRFREAEVGLFIRMQKNGIGQIKLKPLTLSVNFRSTATLIEWNNTHFQDIFPPFHNMATGAVTYSKSVSLEESGDNKQDTAIAIRGLISENPDTQASHISSLIQEIKANYPDEKIAILVKSRSHLSSIIPQLKKAKIPYRAVDIDSLTSRQTIQDLLSLTCAMLHPADRISWLALLRAPWCGLTLADLLIIAGCKAHTPIWEQLENKETMSRLSDESQKRLAVILPLLKKKITERERVNLRYWIESTWILLGGPACLHDYAEIDDANAFFKLLDKMSQNHSAISIENLKDKIEQLFASGQQDETMLQIMTIHTAKGLEFDTVILPHLERKSPNDDKSLLVWMERPLMNDQVSLLLAPIHATGNDKDSIYEYIVRQQKIKSDYEIDRLFYVATTRAKRRLYLFFDTSQHEKGHFKIESGSFLQKLWPFIEKKQNEIITEALVSHDNQETIKASRQINRLASNWINPIRELAPAKMALHQKQNGFQMIDNQPKLIGITVHRFLQHISQLGINWWSKNSENQQTDAIRKQLKQLGLRESQLQSAIKMVHQAIQNTLSDAKGQWILQPHQEAKSEFAITANIHHKLENLVIDRTFVDENDVRWIIDYKTTTFSHHDLEQFLTKEQDKYLEKMRLYQQALRLMDDRPIHLGLYFPALPAWREWHE